MPVFVWGSNADGQLALGRKAREKLLPTAVDAVAGADIASVACGESHCLAVTSYGRVLGWGRNKEGQLTGSGITRDEPAAVAGLDEHVVMGVAAGTSHSLALTSEGLLFAWGLSLVRSEAAADGAAVVGIGRTISPEAMARIKQSHFEYFSGGADVGANRVLGFERLIVKHPVQVDLPAGERAASAAAGYSFSVVVSESGRLFTFGINEEAQLGLGHRFNIDTPHEVAPFGPDLRAAAVACGLQHTLVLTRDGALYSFGSNSFGALGLGHARSVLRPQRVTAFEGMRVVKISCGSHHSAALVEREAGAPLALYTWGHGEYSQLGGAADAVDWSGEGNEFSYASPQELVIAGDGEGGGGTMAMRDVRCGHLHTMVLNDRGQVFAFGWGAGGQLGQGNKRFSLQPRLIWDLGAETVVRIDAGMQHSVAVTQSTGANYAHCFAEMVASDQFADLELDVGDGKGAIAAHAGLVFARCPRLAGAWHMRIRFCGLAPGATDALLVPGRCARAPFLSVLRYLYTDRLECAPHIVHRVAAVARFLGLPHLEHLCRQRRLRQANATTKSLSSLERVDSTFRGDMAAMLERALGADISLGDEEGSRPAHRLVLARTSPYWQRMLEAGFLEHTAKVLRIPEADEELFGDFLRYVYARSLGEHDVDRLVSLMILGDRFIVGDLVQECEAALMALGAVHVLEDVHELADIAESCGAHRLHAQCRRMAL